MGEPVPINQSMKESVAYSLRTNLHVWLFHSTEAFKQHMSTELKKSKNTVVESLSLGVLSLEAIRPLTAPDVIIVEGRGNWATKIAELHDYDTQFKDVDASLIVFGDESDTNALRVALRVGASDFLSEHSTFEDMLPMFRTIAEQKIANRDMGELFIFLNSKGGNGATTVAINTAVELSERYPNQVLLIDIDTQFGLLPEYLDIDPKYTMFDAIDQLQELDESSISSIVTHYDSKLHTIGFGRGSGSAVLDKMEQIQKIVPLLRQFYKFIVIDYSRGIEPAFASLVTPATKAFLVLQQNYMSLKNSSHLVKTLKFEYGIAEESIELVVNRFDKKQPISLKDVCKTVPDLKTHIIPNDFKAANESANLGKPVTSFRKKSAISKAINQLSASLTPDVREKKGWLSRLFN